MNSFKQNKSSSPGIVKYILYTGLIAGTLDISASFINFLITSGGKNPLIVLYYIASGVFGQSAFLGGIFYAVLGLMFHFIIAYSFVSLYFLNYQKVKRYFKNKYLIGIIYGIITWLVMNLIVVPLSHTPPNPHSVYQVILHVIFLILFIGFPAAISAELFFR
jgi:membrane protease YdiL (CAAX protease family)